MSVVSIEKSRAFEVEELKHAARHPLKRLLDICGALAILVFVSPLLAVAAMLVRLDSPGPAIFQQRRTGLNGKEFKIYKFRSMRVLEDGAAVTQATQGDARVTRIGRFLRKSSIDELPQIFNVLKGDMSFVGPRPHAVAHDQYYGELLPDYGLRFRVRPGITGLAQISGSRGETQTVDDMAKRVELDNQYIDQWCIRNDFTIALKTVGVLFSGDAY